MAQRIESAAAAGDGPPTVRRGVARRALLAVLDEVLDTGTGIVVGPRGSGKTTLMAQWVHESGLRALWARAGREGITLRAGGRARTTTPAELGGILRASSAPTLLVLDDVHELRGAAADEVEQLLLSAPPAVRVLMGTRREPSYTLARSEIGAPVVLTATDLRLRTWEVDRLFRDVYGHPLTSDDVETLTHETEGWAAAVHLFHRATDGLLPADRRRAVRTLRSDTRYASDYLVGEVLAELDRPLVDLLHRGSVFDELTAERCDALTAATPGGAPTPTAPLLRELERTWSLATTQDGVHFRLPRVLHRHLRAAQSERLGAAARAWQERAREVLGREAAPDDARRPADGTPSLAGGASGTPDAALADLLALVAPALRRDPAGHVERARQVGGAVGWFAEGLCLLLAGHQRGATGPLRRAAADPDASRALVLGASLAEAVLSGDRPVAVLRALDRVQVEADRHGHTWLARLAHGLIVGLDGTAAARVQSRAYAADRLADGDPWGSALVLTWSALAGLSIGAVEPQAWDELVGRWQALDAAVLAAWTRAAYALTAAAEQLPDAWQEARAAEAVARAAGSPGALAYAYAALARTGRDGSEELAALAESTGREAGVDMRPCWAVGLRRVRPAPVDPSPAPGPATAAVQPAPDDARPVLDRAPRLEVACLGEFRLVVDGTPADLSRIRPRARAVLHVLAVHAGRPVHREQLAETLWPDLDPRAALHNLHVSVSAVRRALEPRVPTRASRLLVRDGEAYALVLRPGSTCDVDELERAARTAAHRRVAGDLPAAAAALRQVLDLYTGDLLPEDGPAEWVAGPRSRLRLLVADAAADLAEVELAQGHLAAAVAAAGRSIELDECRDRAWRLLVAGCTAAGDAAAAHRATLGYREMLDTLGVPVAVAGAPDAVMSGPGARPPRPPRASAASRGRWS